MPDAGYLTIGKVVKKLQEQYPDLTISKVRYLEDEGLLSPSRTPGGYRLYSPADVHRLERILYLQKSRFMPLAVIKEELERPAGAAPAAEGLLPESVALPPEGDGDADKLHPIDRMPEVAGVSAGFARQLSEAGIITLKRSPHGRDLVDGRDLPLIRVCAELHHLGIEPRNLRQYVTAANRESPMFAQALVSYGKKAGGVEFEATDEDRQRFEAALSRMLSLTNALRDELISRRVRESFKGMGG